MDIFSLVGYPWALAMGIFILARYPWALAMDILIFFLWQDIPGLSPGYPLLGWLVGYPWANVLAICNALELLVALLPLFCKGPKAFCILGLVGYPWAGLPG